MKHLGLLTVLALLALPAFSQILGEPVIHWDFADGIPEDFINTGPGPDAAWQYRGPETIPDNSVGSLGACAGNFGPIESQSVENGFVLFDSAFWDDNDDLCDGFGGQYEGPHEATLETPALDLTSNESAILTWQQFVRHYQCTTTVSISVDGGSTWDVIHDNGEWYIIGDEAEWVTLNISDVAAGVADVRFRFNFVGDHYWWMLDDIVVYEPNDNDIQMLSSTYTLFDFNQEPDGYGDIAYSVYPEVMLSPLNIRSRAKNIGALEQTGVTLSVSVLHDGSEVLNQSDGPSDLDPDQVTTFDLNPWQPSEVGDYEISYSLTQDQSDQNPANNTGVETFSIHPYEYARDNGVTENQYLGIPLFYEQEFFMGNMFESRENDLVIHSIGFALGDSTTVGTEVTGRIVNRDSTNVILAETAPYTVNLWDLNSVGESNFVWIPLEEPLVTVDSALYFAGVHHAGGSEERARIAQSGFPPVETTLLSYPESNSLFYMESTPMVRLGIYQEGQTPGCTDETASNYDPAADAENGSCRYPGCTIEDAENYEPEANFYDGSCILPGCTDPEAVNYYAYASEDDGSCLFEGCTNPDADNYDPDADLDDGSCIVSGCTDMEADNYNPDATVDDESCFYLGCTDPEADNYDETATTDDGTCEYLGCTNPDADNFDPEANVDDGSCIVSGCTDPEADNYNPEANNEDDSCIYLGCTDPDADNYDETANEDDGSCQYLGCTDAEALNYDPEANTDDGSCQYSEAFFTLSDTAGCAPFELTITNGTAVSEDGSCFWDFDLGTTSEDCILSIGYVYTEPGTYTISYDYTISDVTTSYSEEFVVYPDAVIPVSEFNDETNEVSCANCPLDAVIEWYLDDEPTGITDFSFEAVENGDYSILLTDINGCSAAGDAITVIVVGIEEIAGPTWHAWPNPARDVIHYQTSLAEGGVVIRDLQGRLINRGELATGQQQFLDVSQLSEGVYLLEWQYRGQRTQKRIVITR